MKESELRKHSICSLCRKKIGEFGLPLFWRVSIERFGVDLKAIRRQDGLTAFLGGHAGLAMVMGPDKDLAKPLMDKITLTVCENCAVEQRVILAALAECEESK